MIAERRTTIPEVPPDLMQMIDLRDEAMRLASFCQSSRTRGGRIAPLYPLMVTHPFAGYATEADYLGDDPDPYPEVE
jgi:hypothetical protein